MLGVEPPATGTMGSSSPFMIKDGNRAGWGTRIGVECAGVGRGRRDLVGELAREPEGHHCAVRMPGDVDARWVGTVLRNDPIDQRRDEADIVDVLLVCVGAAIVGIPGEQPVTTAGTVWIDRDEAVRVGQLREAARPFDLLPAPSTAV